LYFHFSSARLGPNVFANQKVPAKESTDMFASIPVTKKLLQQEQELQLLQKKEQLDEKETHMLEFSNR
jgi:hypothetical protein